MNNKSIKMIVMSKIKLKMTLNLKTLSNLKKIMIKDILFYS